ncbi:MAG: hypothetical protein KDB03_11925 [Planctomycetales bacterium]|nr:hypothetical protein [Planctomycetales bacterium]
MSGRPFRTLVPARIGLWPPGFLQRPRQSLAVVAIGMLSIALVAGQVFTTFAPYDDEGYVLQTIRSVCRGAPLYRETFAQYGPAFYAISQLIHDWGGLPLSHDAVRFKTIAYALVCCGLGAVVLRRICGNGVVALCSTLFIALQLSKFGLEPGHPQEFALLVSLISIAIIPQPGEKQSGFRWWAAGLCAGLAGMTKINCGIVSAIPLLFAAYAVAVYDSKNTLKKPKVEIALLSILGSFFPLYVLWHSLHSVSAAVIPAILLTAICLCVGGLLHLPNRTAETVLKSESRKKWFTKWQSIFLVSAGGLTATAVSTVYSTWHGSSLSDLRWGLLDQHNRFTQTFLHAMPFDELSILLSVSGIAISLGHVGLGFGNGLVSSRWWLLWSGLMGLRLISALALDVPHELVHGLQIRRIDACLVSLAPALAIGVLLGNARLCTLRVALAFSATFWPLLAYPTPGTQYSIGALPLLLCVCVIGSDILGARRCALTLGNSYFSDKVSMWILRGTIILGATSLLPVAWRWSRYESMNLPGCHWLRQPHEIVERERALAAAINDVDSPYLVFDAYNHNRFYFWTNKRPLSAVSPTFWPYLLDESQLTDWQQLMNKTDGYVVVVPPEVYALSTPRTLPIHYQLVAESKLVIEIDGWQVRYHNSQLTDTGMQVLTSTGLQ